MTRPLGFVEIPSLGFVEFDSVDCEKHTALMSRDDLSLRLSLLPPSAIKASFQTKSAFWSLSGEQRTSK
jgi:hypothetical protein